MFERFTGPARRVLFWARLEAGQRGSDCIDPEHLLLGVLAEDQRDWLKSIPALTGERNIGVEYDPTPAPAQFFTAETAAILRQMLKASTGPPKADIVDMPVSERSDHVLAATAEYAGTRTVTVLHILRGLMDDSAVGTVLASAGITIAQIDDAIRRQ